MMFDFLEGIDHAIVQTINGWNTPVLDEVMWLLSGKLTWIPLYLLLIILYLKDRSWQQTLVYVLLAVSVVAIADLGSVHLFKEVFLRYRPSHNLELGPHLHFYHLGDGELYKGGTYGFISSHAANFFGLLVFAGLCLRDRYKSFIWWMMGIAIIVSVSRIYLGVHYFSDVLFGGIFGATIGVLMYRLVYLNLRNKIK